MFKIFDIFRSPTLKAKMIKGGAQVKVSLINLKPQQTMILLFMAIKQIAKSLGMQDRELMNKIIALDKSIVRDEKHAERKAKYGK